MAEAGPARNLEPAKASALAAQAIGVYGLHPGIPSDRYTVEFDPLMLDVYGETASNGDCPRVRLGPRAFASASTLVATLLHEFVHVRQIVAYALGKQGVGDTEMAELECEAYYTEMRAGKDLQLESNEAEYASRRFHDLLTRLPEDRRRLAEHGEFRLRPAIQNLPEENRV
ncbi:MAG: hypothetical protein HYZ53_21905 [Planctomycetes bacterium]|nr:hypothetical protein [Planctomycetota bacterium]